MSTMWSIPHVAAAQSNKEVTMNNAMDWFNRAIADLLTQPMADGNVTLSSDDALRNACIVCTGALTAGRNLVVPATKKLYLVKNDTDGNGGSPELFFDITVKTPSGTGVAIPNGQTGVVYCDGVNVIGWVSQSADAVSLRGVSIASDTPSEGDVLTCQSGEWTPVAPAAPTDAMVRIAETILGADTATIAFSSIPGTYRNLRLIITGRSDSATDQNVYMQFNGDTGSNYDSVLYYAGGTTGAITSYATDKPCIGHVCISTAPANQAGTTEITICDYARTVWLKNAHSLGFRRTGASDGYTISFGMDWRNTAAITDILLGITTVGVKFVAGTVATLYGMP